MFVSQDHYIWDFWLAPRTQGEPFHVYYLRAPRSLADPEDRHLNATIGHAVSLDLINWTELPPALTPGEPGAWDDQATWTGSVIRHDDRFWMFYTGVEARTRGRIQRIGAAVSRDLTNWTRVGSDPLLEPAGPHYVTDETRVRGGVDFRDPWVVRDDDGDRFLMFFTAAAPGVAAGRCGIVGLAESRDLLEWSLLPPVTSPGFHGQVEVPQPVKFGDCWILLFCTDAQAADYPGLEQTGPWMGTHYFVSDSLTGPYELVPGAPLLGDAAGSYYAGRIVEGVDGSPHLMAWRRLDERGAFVGGLSNPAPIELTPDGHLDVDSGALWR